MAQSNGYSSPTDIKPSIFFIFAIFICFLAISSLYCPASTVPEDSPSGLTSEKVYFYYLKKYFYYKEFVQLYLKWFKYFFKVAEVFLTAGHAFQKLGDLALKLRTPISENTDETKWENRAVDRLKDALTKFAHELDNISDSVQARTVYVIKSLNLNFNVMFIVFEILNYFLF